MSIAVVLFLVFALIAFGALIFGARRSRIAAVVLMGFCLLLSAFSIFGFLASFEPMEASVALIAKVSYVLLFCLAVPSDWTQDIPARHGARLSGLHCYRLYPHIEERLTEGDM